MHNAAVPALGYLIICATLQLLAIVIQPLLKALSLDCAAQLGLQN